MKFQKLAQYWQKIEETASRNEMIVILAKLFQEVSPEEIDKICYLSLGILKPSYEAFEFNLSERTIAEVLSRISSFPKEEINHNFKKVGDWGKLTQRIVKNKESDLVINSVYERLLEIASQKGNGSQNRKIKLLEGLLNQLDSLSAKYIVRVIIKKLRLGFSEMTILDAFSWMEVRSKELREQIELSYNICADIGKIAVFFKQGGMKSLQKIKIQTGIPVISSAAERLSIPEEIYTKLGHCYLEPKIDGFRLQVHLDKKKQESVNEGSLFREDQFLVRFFSRNLENMTGMFPELQLAVAEINCQSAIIEGEAVAYDQINRRFLPFQQTITRKRKYEIKEKATENPLTLFVFDLLYLNGESYIEKPFTERRGELKKLISHKQKNLRLISQIKANSANEIAQYFKEQKRIGLEGIMAKMINSPYKAGSRGFHWIKYKRKEGDQIEDTIDVVVLGYYLGKGKRSDFGIGALLVGVYNKRSEMFETIAKIGTGIKDEEFVTIKKDCDKIKRKDAAKNVRAAKELTPDVWVEPEIVAVVLADEITKSPLHTAGKKEKLGYALRFPRLITWNRRDKNIFQVTNVEEIKDIYQRQLNK